MTFCGLGARTFAAWKTRPHLPHYNRMNMPHWGMLRISWLISVSLALIATAYAQTSRGTVTGTVLDSSGAAVARASIALTSRGTGVRLTTGSNEAGVYRFDAVDLGVYDLQVTHPGFRTFFGPGITVEANRTITIDPKLELGATETTVEVNEEASGILVKDSPLRGGNFQSREVRNLPLAGLNPLSLARTLPGATEASGSRVWGGGTATGSNNGGGFSVNGQRPRGNNYLLDGAENNDVTAHRHRASVHYRRRRRGSISADRQLRRRIRPRRRGRIQRGDEVGHKRTARHAAVALPVSSGLTRFPISTD